MLSVTVTTSNTKPFSLSNHHKTHLTSTFLNLHHPLLTFHPPSSPKPLPLIKPISATISPSSTPPPNPQQQQLYQPFRPPPSPLPTQFRSLDPNRRLEILANRLGLWFDYAPLIPSLIQEGFSPSYIEELTGISGVEQNCLVVAAQVRDSLIQSGTDPETLSFFDSGGGELLYEIRLLSATQRTAAARYVVDNRLDSKDARELARAMKDFPRRRGDHGWESFNYTLPGDCLSFMFFRQSKEHRNPSERKAALEQALGAAETEKAKARLLEELEVNNSGAGAKKGKEGEIESGVKVPVVRMTMGEVAEATLVVVLPVCKAEEREKEVLEAPWECRSEGEFGVVAAEKGWKRWVVLPGWEPVAGLAKGGVVVAFRDARALPWKVNRWYKEEAILVVADRGRKEVAADDGFYLVAVFGNDGELKVERGSALKEMGVEQSLGTVVLVVRPPRENIEYQLSDEDWE